MALITGNGALLGDPKTIWHVQCGVVQLCLSWGLSSEVMALASELSKTVFVRAGNGYHPDPFITYKRVPVSLIARMGLSAYDVPAPIPKRPSARLGDAAAPSACGEACCACRARATVCMRATWSPRFQKVTGRKDSRAD
ncbi:MAG: hypothetical protein ACLUI3_07375 [Christensenellales bacterium]